MIKSYETICSVPKDTTIYFVSSWLWFWKGSRLILSFIVEVMSQCRVNRQLLSPLNSVGKGLSAWNVVYFALRQATKGDNRAQDGESWNKWENTWWSYI